MTACEANTKTGARVEARPAITHFDFQAKVFAVPGARFALVGPRKEPRFFVTLGDLDGSVEIQALRTSFSIAAGSHDDELVTTAVRALRYIADVRPGDKIPSEIIDGTASWPISATHRETASRRLQVQLLSWVSGKEIVITENDELTMFLDQIENKTRLREAFEAAAEALGRPRSDHESVLMQIELLARELCFIEALRDRFAKITEISQKLEQLRRYYGGDAKSRGELQRVMQLITQALTIYMKRFEEIDAQTSEVIGALKSLERQIEFIRNVRDDLRYALRDWDPLIVRWQSAAAGRSRAVDILVSDTYRLLASKFTLARSILKVA
jgi:hypothetical protein